MFPARVNQTRFDDGILPVFLPDVSNEGIGRRLKSASRPVSDGRCPITGLTAMGQVRKFKRANEKAALRRLHVFDTVDKDQAVANAGLAFRRTESQPRPQKPSNIMAQVEGSGTAEAIG